MLSPCPVSDAKVQMTANITRREALSQPGTTSTIILCTSDIPIYMQSVDFAKLPNRLPHILSYILWDVQGWAEIFAASSHPNQLPPSAPPTLLAHSPPSNPPAAYFAKLSRLRISLRIVIKLSPPPSLFLNSDTVTNYHDWERQDWMGDVNLDKFAID